MNGKERLIRYVQTWGIMTKAGIKTSMTFRSGYYLIFFGNIIYLVITYFLWKAIYASENYAIINGMTFNDTLVYLVLASSMYNVLQVWVVGYIGDDVKTGQISLDIVKPINYFFLMFMKVMGDLVTKVFLTFVPTLVAIYILTDGYIVLRINFIFFVMALVVSIGINYCIDFSLGMLAVFMESTLGINMIKETIVSLLSGAIIPLAFFPDTLKHIVYFLPFRAIYDIPLQLLLDKSNSIMQLTELFLVQIIWLAILILITKLIWKKTSNKIFVNGG